MTNIYNKPNYSDISNELRDEYHRLRKLYDAPEIKKLVPAK